MTALPFVDPPRELLVGTGPSAPEVLLDWMEERGYPTGRRWVIAVQIAAAAIAAAAEQSHEGNESRETQ